MSALFILLDKIIKTGGVLMNGPQEIDVNKRLKIMSIVFGALLLGQLAFMVVVVTQQFTNV